MVRCNDERRSNKTENGRDVMKVNRVVAINGTDP